MEDEMRVFVEKLLSWHKSRSRSFSWRRETNAYSITVAAVLLRRTRAEMVEPVYEEIMRRWPSPHQLAEASEEELQQLLKPIGLFRGRARELKEIGRFLAEGGDWAHPPKGIGPYALSIIKCFALGQPALAVDSNVRRVLSRVFGSEEATALLEKLVSGMGVEEARRLNLSLIDFGALVCKPRLPRCKECPLRHLCSWFEKNLGELYSSNHSSSSSSQNSSSPSSSQNSSSPHSSSSSSHSSSHSSSSIIG